MAYWSGVVTFHSNTGICPGHQAFFTSAGSQEGWFMAKSVGTMSQSSQIYPNKPNRFNFAIDDLTAVDYISWVNTDLSNRRYYAAVTERNWVNANCAELMIQFDPFQTYMFDYLFSGAYVEREMVSAADDWDGRFKYRIPESLQVGDYHAVSEQLSPQLDAVVPVLFYCADSDGTPLPGSVVNGVYSGAQFVSGEAAVNARLAAFANQGVLDTAVIGIVLIPQGMLLSNSNTVTHTPNMSTWYSGYVPKYSKCFTTPYNMCVVECPGGYGEYYYELFSNPTSATFTRQDSVSLTPARRLFPTGYRGRSEDVHNSVVMTGFPMVASAGNSFANWVANNANSLVGGIVKSAAAGFAVGGPAGAVAAGVSSAFSSALTVADKAVNQTQQVTNASGTTLYAKFNDYVYRIYQMQTDDDTIRAVDNFFHVFGYKVNRAKIPELRSRQFWNYVKTSNCSITCPGTPADKQTIANMFNNGVTLWHVDAGINIGDYRETNP